MYQRLLQLADIVSQKSHFLLGPRQTGKSSLCRASFPNSKYIDLLEADTFRTLNARPELLRLSLKQSDKLIVIDEIQKCIPLLDEVQLLIDRDKSLRFLLTGSSARKLKRGAANLLPGRVWTQNFHPLVFPENQADSIQLRMAYGGLPGVISSENPAAELKNYIGSYLKEEIQAEGLTRNIGNFARFLEIAGDSNCEQMNYSTISNQSGIPLKTIRDYFQILQDTNIANLLPVFQKKSVRKPVSTPKCYFFDVGVANALRKNLALQTSTVELGKRLEHLIYCELIAYKDYVLPDTEITYWRTQDKLEVDFILNDKVAIEVKNSEKVGKSDIKGMRALQQEFPNMKYLVVCNTLLNYVEDGIEYMSVQKFLEDLWGGVILS